MRCSLTSDLSMTVSVSPQLRLPHVASASAKGRGLGPSEGCCGEAPAYGSCKSGWARRDRAGGLAALGGLVGQGHLPEVTGHTLGFPSGPSHCCPVTPRAAWIMPFHSHEAPPTHPVHGRRCLPAQESPGRPSLPPVALAPLPTPFSRPCQLQEGVLAALQQGLRGWLGLRHPGPTLAILGAQDTGLA